ncbi:MAG: hypothetical protein LQ351_006138 [Letrouitia transgressa]|nr:MAG: hypothetical protein LQ351_006138 [Letrouitia transgressa]
MSVVQGLSKRLYDVIIVGAGISGINAAYRLQTQIPSAGYTILEARGKMGGTYSFFRYPGFGADSDLYSFGFEWRPWRGHKTIISGETACQYICESAAAYGIDRKVKFNHRLVSAHWSSHRQEWTLLVDRNGQMLPFNARFVVLGTGYYNYDEPLESPIPGIQNFSGPVIHPQFWPEQFDYKGKYVVVVGSGSTSVTLVPSLAKTARVDMLQRSPSFIVSQPSTDPFGAWARRILPFHLAYRLTRFRFLFRSLFFITFCRWFPQRTRMSIYNALLKELPRETVERNFQPSYAPLEQRLCTAPDGEFFEALRTERAHVITDTIVTITERDIELASGRSLRPDIIVTATGLKLLIGGGAKISIDDAPPITISEKFLWRNTMLQDVPNMALMTGYPDAPWTLGADVNALLVRRLLKTMRQQGFAAAVPRIEPADDGMKGVPSLHLKSTYVIKGADALPKTGDKAPWLPRSHYLLDLCHAKFTNISKGLRFEKANKDV